MDFPYISAPSPYLSVKNWLATRLLVKPYFDPDYDPGEFVEGAKAAVAMITGCMSEGDFDALESVVEASALRTMRENWSLFSAEQKRMYRLEKEDVYWGFIYQLGIIMEEGDTVNNRFDDNGGE